MILSSGAPCLAASSWSFEDGFESWFSPGEGFASVTRVSVADGAPAAAITDGSYAVRVDNFAGGGFAALFRAPGGVVDENEVYMDVAYDALKANTTLSLDLYVPASAVEGLNDWAEIRVVIEGDGMGGEAVRTNVDVRTANDEGAAGQLFNVSWDYTLDPAWNPNATWAQINLHARGQSNLTPFYIDNVRLTGAAQGLSGDFNGDGFVDAADYTVWRDNYGAPDDSVLLGGNGDGGDVGDSDYALWSSNYGIVASTATALSIPEPTALACLIAALGMAAARRR